MELKSKWEFYKLHIEGLDLSKIISKIHGSNLSRNEHSCALCIKMCRIKPSNTSQPKLFFHILP